MTVVNDGFLSDLNISYKTLQTSYLTYLENKDDWSKWKDLFEGSEGQIIIEFLSAKTAYEVVKIMNCSNETYMQYVTQRSSALAIAQNSSYCAGRGTNKKLTFTITPDQTVILPKFSIVGVCGDYDLILAEQASLTSGVSTSISVYIGLIKDQSLTANTSSLLTFRFTNSNISDVYRLFLNDVEVPTSSSMLDLLEDKYVAISNALGGVDVIYLNSRTSFTHRYSSSDVLKLEYIEYADISYTDVTVEFEYGEITAQTDEVQTIEQEQTKSIQINAPLFADTQNRIVARADFEKKLKQLHPLLLDTKGSDFSNPIVQVSYCMQNSILLEGQNLTNIENTLSSLRTFGIPMCYILHSHYLNVPISIVVTTNTTSYSQADILQSIRDVLAKYEYTMNITIDLYAIEQAVELLDYVKTARVSFAAEDYANSAAIQLGKTYTPSTSNGFIYFANKWVYDTGDTEPTWPTTVGETVMSNGIIYKCLNAEGLYATNWSANQNIYLYKTLFPSVYNNYMYQVIGYNYKSSSSTPDVSGLTLYSIINDNNIRWEVISKKTTANLWSSNTHYSLGDIVNIADFDYSLQCIDYIRYFNTTEPSWPTNVTNFESHGCQFLCVSETDTALTVPWNSYVRFAENVTVGG